MSGKIAVFLADGFEEIEALTVVDILRRADIETITVSVMGKKRVTGSHDIPVEADTVIEDLDFDTLEMIVLPGGKNGTKNLENTKLLTDRILEFDRAGRKISAICAAPGILGRLGILKGRKACCYPGCEEDSWGASILTDKTVKDGHILTSRGMGTSIAFALEITSILKDRGTADALAQKIVYT